MEQRGGRQGALTARCGGAGACVEPRWQPEENDRGGARPLELLGQPSVTYYRGSARLTRTRDGNGPDLIPLARLPGVGTSRDAAEKRCL